VNDVQFAYNDSNQVLTTYQSHSGAVNTSSSPNVQYTYDATLTGSIFSNQHRLQTIVYPNGRTVYYDYGASGTAYNALSNLRTIWDTNPSGTALATYDENGAGSRQAVTTLPQPSLKLDLFQGTSGTYAGLDRFGRVVDQYWKGYGTTSDADRIHYAYDYSGSRIYRDIDAAIYPTNNDDQAYTYDALHRLTTLQQGTLSGTTISGTPTNEEDWTLDGLGNWPNYVTKASGTTNLNQSRTVTAANAISGISATVGSTWATPAYDLAGNMTTIPEPASPTLGYTATYDAWNRLVQLVDATSSQTVQQNQYDGRNFRTMILNYSGGTLSETRHSYFTDDWRCVEERVGTATTADRQFVWGGRYIDDLVLRDRGSERLYALQDGNWNVTAIANSSGAIQERYVYAGYGTPLFLNSSFGFLSSSGYAWETLFGGYRFDTSSGISQVRNRTYHPTLGTWCQRDPVGYAAGDANLQRYVGSFPTNWSDPSGLRTWFGYIGETGEWIGSMAMGGGQGLAQGVANTANGVQDGIIAVPNMVPLVWNSTAGNLGAPELGYIPSPDWSNNLIIQDDPTHGWSKGLGGTGVTTLIGVGPARVCKVLKGLGGSKSPNGKMMPNPVQQQQGNGSYVNTHQSGKQYIGKGDASRMEQSAAEKATQYGDPVISKEYTPAPDAKQSFINEQNALEAAGGPGGNTYNKINSPGKKMRDGK
jgi:RHS repeat-associated protein